MPKIKTQSDLFEDLTLIEKIDHVMIEYNIKNRSKFPYTEWLPLIAWEVKMTIEDVAYELKKMYVEPLNN